MRIVDAHNHPDWHGHGFERFVANMDKFGIDQTWLLSWEAPEDECDPGYRSCLPWDLVFGGQGPIPFGHCLEYARRAPKRFILGYAPDPRRPQAVEMLRAAVEIYGVRVCGEVKVRMMYDSPDALALFEACGEMGLPVVIHLDYQFQAPSAHPRADYWYGGGFDTLERALKACPETTFLGHAPGFWAHISGLEGPPREQYPEGKVRPGGAVPETLRRCENLYCDISSFSGLNALQRDPEFARTFLIEFQDRLVYGRDCFDNRRQDLLRSLDLDDEVLAKVLSGNADRLLAARQST